jgi:hypothetical protein
MEGVTRSNLSDQLHPKTCLARPEEIISVPASPHKACEVCGWHTPGFENITFARGPGDFGNDVTVGDLAYRLIEGMGHIGDAEWFAHQALRDRIMRFQRTWLKLRPRQTRQSVQNCVGNSVDHSSEPLTNGTEPVARVTERQIRNRETKKRKSYTQQEVMDAIEVVRKMPHVSDRVAMAALQLSQAEFYRRKKDGPLKPYELKKGFVYSAQIIGILDRGRAQQKK